MRKEYYIPAPIKGVVETIHPKYLADDACVFMRNYLTDEEKGIIVGRNALDFCKKYELTIKQVFPCIIKGTEYLMLETATASVRQVYYVKDIADAPTLVKDSLDLEQDVSFAVFKEKLWISNGMDNMLIWDGTTLQELTVHTFQVIKGQFLFTEQVAGADVRLWIFRAFSDPTLAYFSGLTDADGNLVFPEEASAWETENLFNYIYFGKGDGETITGVCDFKGEIFVFKENSLWKILGDNPNNYRPVKVFDNIGCSQPHTIVHRENDIVFTANDGHIYSFSGATIKKLTGQL